MYEQFKLEGMVWTLLLCQTRWSI